MLRARYSRLLITFLLVACAAPPDDSDGNGSPDGAPVVDSPGRIPPPDSTPVPPTDTTSPPPPPPDPGRSSGPAPGWVRGTAQGASRVNASQGVPVATAIRTARQADFDRFTVEFAPGDGLPGYKVEYVDKPLIQCGSGAQIFPVGDAWLELRLEPTNAHTEEGRPTLPGREIPATGEIMRRVYMTCDFEAVVVLTIAVDYPGDFRVLTLSNPTRIVIDVKRSR